MATSRVVPNLHATDPGAAEAFCADVLGLEKVMDQGWIATFAAPGNPVAQLSFLSQDATAPVVADVSVEVDDVDGAYEKARADGYEIVHPLTDEPWGVRRFFVREPASGKVVNVLTHRAR